MPSPFAGKISALKVKIGDKVSKGSVLALIDDENTKVEQKPSEQEKEKTKPQELKEDNLLPETEKIIKEAESTKTQTPKKKIKTYFGKNTKYSSRNRKNY